MHPFYHDGERIQAGAQIRNDFVNFNPAHGYPQHQSHSHGHQPFANQQQGLFPSGHANIFTQGAQEIDNYPTPMGGAQMHQFYHQNHQHQPDQSFVSMPITHEQQQPHQFYQHSEMQQHTLFAPVQAQEESSRTSSIIF